MRSFESWLFGTGAADVGLCLSPESSMTGRQRARTPRSAFSPSRGAREFARGCSSSARTWDRFACGRFATILRASAIRSESPRPDS